MWRGGQERLKAGIVTHEPLELLVVHRPKYDDWSFPKGKLETGELLPACAVREIAEETGCQVCLGPLLTVTDYPVDGVDKQVTYWLASLKNSPALLARPYVKPASKKEIDARRWVSLAEAQELLTHKFDRDLAQRAGELLTQGWGESRPVALLRHAKAKKREKWRADDALRPLKRKGQRQAQRITSVLSAFGISRVVTSPWKRCEQTMEPYLRATAIYAESEVALSEKDFATEPKDAVAVLNTCISQADVRGGTVICSHRPVLAALVEQLRKLTDEEATNDCESDWEPLDLAEVMVAHFAYPDTGKTQILSVERYTAISPLAG